MESTDILKYLEGRSSEAEKRKLVKWLDASPDHVKEFEEIRFVFEMTKIYDSECREFLAERSDKPHEGAAWGTASADRTASGRSGGSGRAVLRCRLSDIPAYGQ